MNRVWTTILATLALAAPVFAQEPEPDDARHTHIESITPEPAAARVGETFHLVFKVKVDPGWHIYSALGTYAPTLFTFDAGMPIEAAGKVVETKPKEHREVLGKKEDGTPIRLDYDYHEGDVTFRVPVRWTQKAVPGPIEVTGKMPGQECDPNGCALFQYPWTAKLEVADGAKAEPATVKAGETFHLVFHYKTKPGWHIYSANGKYNPTSWRFDKGVPVERAGKVEEPKTNHKRDEFGEGPDKVVLEYDYIEGDITFRVPVRLTTDAKPGPLRITGRMDGQECDNACIDFDYAFVADVTVAGGAVAPPKAVDAQAPDTGDASTEAAKNYGGFLWLMGWAVLGGLISLVMPCVYPLIPITITFFAKQAGESRSHGIMMSLAYSAGIIITFSGLGILLILLLGAQGAQIFASNPWVNLVIAAVFMTFALSLLGLFELKLPAFLTNLSGGSGPRTGVGGAFVLGLLFSVITFTCTIPIAGVIFALAASETHKAAGMTAIFVYSLVMAIPFLFLGFFPSLVKEIPKSGGWLHTMKIAAGLFEVALAAAYIWKSDLIWGWGVFDRPVVLSIWIAVSFIMALYLLGLFRVRGDSENTGVGIGRVLSGLAFGAIGFYLVGGLLGRPVGVFGIVLPPDSPSAVTSAAKSREYEHLAEAEAAAKKEGKPLFIEFTGYT
ncbi:MAG TPA: cytochrome c biogenesis protein CcdA [Planctomycetota bacterium]|nr:cytochrome c biogenesis protein CcdA [Planctomycetota bacterium]